MFFMKALQQLRKIGHMSLPIAVYTAFWGEILPEIRKTRDITGIRSDSTRSRNVTFPVSILQ